MIIPSIFSDHQCSSPFQLGVSVSKSGQKTQSWDWHPPYHPSVIRAQPLVWSLDPRPPWFLGSAFLDSLVLGSELVTLHNTREIPSVKCSYWHQDLKAKRQYESNIQPVNCRWQSLHTHEEVKITNVISTRHISEWSIHYNINININIPIIFNITYIQ